MHTSSVSCDRVIFVTHKNETVRTIIILTESVVKKIGLPLLQEDNMQENHLQNPCLAARGVRSTDIFVTALLQPL